MGIATFLVALVPGYAAHRHLGRGPADRAALHPGHRRRRRMGRLGAARRWSGRSTDQHRGFIASWPQFGVPAGLFLANLAVLVFSAVSGDQFLTWGWRVPFLLSIVLVGIGLWIRLGILETPVFRRLVAENRIERAPVARGDPPPAEGDHPERARAHGGAGAVLHLHRVRLRLWRGTLQVSRDLLLAAVLVGLGGVVLHDPDRRPSVRPVRAARRVYILGAVVTGVFGFIYFALLEHAGAGADLPRDRAVADPARHDVRAAGGADRRELHRAAALQRRLDRLPARLDHRRRPGAADRRRRCSRTITPAMRSPGSSPPAR